MRTPDLRAAVDKLASLIEEKRHNEKKERKAIETVNRAFRQVGYELSKATVNDAGKRRGRPRSKTVHVHEPNGVGQVVKRKRGRPRVSKLKAL